MASGEKVSITWIEAALLVFLVFAGMGLGTAMKQLIGSLRESYRPRETKFNREAQLTSLQIEAASAQTEVTALQAKLAEQRVELAKQSARLESLKQAYPALDKSVVATPALAEREIAAAFTQAKLDCATTTKFLEELNKRLPKAKEAAIQKASSLTEAEDSAKKGFHEAQQSFTRRTDWIIFGASIGLSLLLLGIARPLVGQADRKLQLGIHRNSVLAGAFVILVILLAYQTFDVSGAALAATVLVLLTLFFVSRKA